MVIGGHRGRQLTGGDVDETMPRPKNGTVVEMMAATARSSAPDVALFLPTLHGGGAECKSVNLSGRFHQLGLRVDLVVGRAEDASRNQVPAGVNVVDL